MKTVYAIEQYYTASGETETIRLFEKKEDAWHAARKLGYFYEAQPGVELYSMVVDDPQYGKRVDVCTMSGDVIWYSIYVTPIQVL